MNAIAEPLVFKPVYSSAPWGGRSIPSRFGRTDAPDVCAESWEISGHPTGSCRVMEGAFAGKTLTDLTCAFGRALVGTKATDPTRFPLLVKLIDANRALSVQVHPNDANAVLTGGEPKTEAWIVLDAAPGAALYAGFAPGVDETGFRSSALRGAPLGDLLARHPVSPGDVFYIPGGTVHAIGAGCLIYEVQQSSDTTYRLYDWDRTDARGQKRPLHVDAALRSIDFSLKTVERRRAQGERRSGTNVIRTFVTSPHFAIHELELNEPFKRTLDGSTFVAPFVLEGGVTVTSGGVSRRVPAGTSFLVPASAGEVRLEAGRGKARLIVTTL